MYKSDKIFVAGHKGLVGSAILRKLQHEGYEQVITKTRGELDLINQAQVEQFFAKEKPDYVFLAAGKVGGILANSSFPADFIYDNLLIQANIINSAYKNGVKRLLYLGSSCIYPKFAPQPMREEHLLTSALEPTNEAYAIAKIAGIKMCQAYQQQYGFDAICVMPTNLYGPNDNFDLNSSHVLPALIRKFHEAKIAGANSVTIWGTGTPRREFLYVDDLAESCIYLMQTSSDVVKRTAPDCIINVGVGVDVTIYELANLISAVVGFDGTLDFDSSKPDGTPRKLLDVSRINELGWKTKMPLKQGVEQSYQWFIQNSDNFRAVNAA